MHPTRCHVPLPFVTTVAPLLPLGAPTRLSRRRRRLLWAAGVSALAHVGVLTWLALAPARLPPPSIIPPQALPAVDVVLVPMPRSALPPTPRPLPEPLPTPDPLQPPPREAAEPAPPSLAPAPVPAPTLAPAPLPSAAPLPAPLAPPLPVPVPRPPTPLVQAPDLRTREEPSVSLRAAPALAQNDAEAERRRREALEAARALSVPAPSTLPAAPSRSPSTPSAGASRPAPPAEPSTYRPPLAGGPRGGVAGLQDPSRWAAGPVGGGVQRALRRSVGCNHENFAGLTNAERAACEERETRLAEANAQDVGPVSTARYIQRGMEDRDCRRARRSDDHASTFGVGAGTGAERTRGGVNTVPGCGTVLRNLDRIGAALRGREHVD